MVKPSSLKTFRSNPLQRYPTTSLTWLTSLENISQTVANQLSLSRSARQFSNEYKYLNLRARVKLGVECLPQPNINLTLKFFRLRVHICLIHILFTSFTSLLTDPLTSFSSLTRSPHFLH
eukprot:GHVN01025238.1.p1 GENE.GHVN01025238.1~~GHVN01025238.1.p1  ORF type:complete len:120 (-),score=27.92 GHVN01025238.1:177-536(-)